MFREIKSSHQLYKWIVRHMTSIDWFDLNHDWLHISCRWVKLVLWWLWHDAVMMIMIYDKSDDDVDDNDDYDDTSIVLLK